MNTCKLVSTSATHSATFRPSQRRPTTSAISPHAAADSQACPSFPLARRHALVAGGATLIAGLSQQRAAHADDFTTTPSGLKYLDLRVGDGATPQPGDTVVIHWAGYTKGYQGKRIDNTSVRDEPYEFKLGAHQVSNNI